MAKSIPRHSTRNNKDQTSAAAPRIMGTCADCRETAELRAVRPGQDSAAAVHDLRGGLLLPRLPRRRDRGWCVRCWPRRFGQPAQLAAE